LDPPSSGDEYSVVEFDHLTKNKFREFLKDMKFYRHGELTKLLSPGDFLGLKKWILERNGKELDILVWQSTKDVKKSYFGFWSMREALSAAPPSPAAYGGSLLGSIVYPDFLSGVGNCLTDVSENERLELTQLMLERGADPNFPAYVNCSPPAIAAGFSTNVNFLKLLIKFGGFKGDELIANWEEVSKNDPDWRNKFDSSHGLPHTAAAVMDRLYNFEYLKEVATIDVMKPHPAFPEGDCMMLLTARSIDPNKLRSMEKLGFDPKKLIDPKFESGLRYSSFFFSITRCPEYAIDILKDCVLFDGPCGNGQQVFFNFENIEIDPEGNFLTVNGNHLFWEGEPHKPENQKPTNLIKSILDSGNVDYFELIIVRYLLQLKWEHFGKQMFCYELAGFVAYFVFFCFIFCFWPVEGCSSGTCLIVAPICLFLAFICVANHTYREFIEFKREGKVYIMDPRNLSDMALVTCSVLVLGCMGVSLFDNFAISPWTFAIGGFQQLIFVLKFTLEFVGINRTFGSLVVMLVEMAKDVGIIGIIFVIFLVGHVNALYVLLSYDDHENRGAYLELFPLVYLWVFSDWDLDVSFSNPVIADTWFFVFVSYTILMVVVLLNMVIARMGNTYSRVEGKSELEWQRIRARLIMKYQENLSEAQLQKYVKDVASNSQKNGAVIIPSAEEERLIAEHRSKQGRDGPPAVVRTGAGVEQMFQQLSEQISSEMTSLCAKIDQLEDRMKDLERCSHNHLEIVGK